MDSARLFARARQLAACCIVLAVAAACASSPVKRRATAISNADRDAKRALQMEGQIDASKIPARTLGVLPFSVAERDTLLQPLGYAMASFLISDLARSSELKLVERERLDAILKELDLIDGGVVEPRTGPRVGRLVGARRLLIGEISSGAGGTITLTARLVDVIAGTVEQLLTASAPLARVLEAEKALAMRVFEELGITLTAAERAEVQQRQTSNLGAMLAFGRGVQAEAHGDASEAVRRFEDAARMDAAFAASRVTLTAQPPAGAGTERKADIGKEEAGKKSEAEEGTGSDKKAAGTQRNTNLDRVLNLAAQVINAPITTKLPEVVDVPVQSQLITLLITVRVF
jgi:TolB-like protein